MNNSVIEMVSYQLKSDANLEQLAQTHQSVNAFLMQQSGFIYRSISQDDDGVLYDIVYWQSMEQAKAAGEAFMASEACQGLMAITDMDSIKIRHMPALSEQCSTEQGAAEQVA